MLRQRDIVVGAFGNGFGSLAIEQNECSADCRSQLGRGAQIRYNFSPVRHPPNWAIIRGLRRIALIKCEFGFGFVRVSGGVVAVWEGRSTRASLGSPGGA
jgi:hypothetical protein